MKEIVASIVKGDYTNPDAVENVIAYSMRLNNSKLIGGYGIELGSPEYISEQFYDVKDHYHYVSNKQIVHVVFSFPRKHYYTPQQIMQLAYKLGEYFGTERQVVFAVHDDTDNPHIHMGVNTVAYTNGKYKAGWDVDDLQKYAERCVYMGPDNFWINK